MKKSIKEDEKGKQGKPTDDGSSRRFFADSPLFIQNNYTLPHPPLYLQRRFKMQTFRNYYPPIVER